MWYIEFSLFRINNNNNNNFLLIYLFSFLLGNIIEIKRVNDFHTGKWRGCCYVSLKNDEDVKTAITLNGRELKERRLRIEVPNIYVDKESIDKKKITMFHIPLDKGHDLDGFVNDFFHSRISVNGIISL
jgi:RNA recognition motif-containing protein